MRYATRDGVSRAHGLPDRRRAERLLPGRRFGRPRGRRRSCAPINRVAAEASRLGAPVVASRDWHPPESAHFVAHGGAWPVHCVQQSAGARFHPALVLPAGTGIVSKGDTHDDPGGLRRVRRSPGRRVALADSAARQAGSAASSWPASRPTTASRTPCWAPGGRDSSAVVLVDAIRAVDVQRGRWPARDGRHDRRRSDVRRNGRAAARRVTGAATVSRG